MGEAGVGRVAAEVVEGVAVDRRLDYPVGEIGECRVAGVQVVGAVVLQEQLAEDGVGLGFGLVGEEAVRGAG
jgi:hypothetical protein